MLPQEEREAESAQGPVGLLSLAGRTAHSVHMGTRGPSRYKYTSGLLQEGRASSFTHRGTCNSFCQGPHIWQHPVRCLAEVLEFFPVWLGHRTRHPGPWPSRSATSTFSSAVSVNGLPSEGQAGSYFLPLPGGTCVRSQAGSLASTGAPAPRGQRGPGTCPVHHSIAGPRGLRFPEIDGQHGVARGPDRKTDKAAAGTPVVLTRESR